MFRTFNNIDPLRTIYFVSDKYPPVYAGDNRLIVPVYYFNSETSMPLLLAIIGLGGTISWSGTNTVFYFNGIRYLVDNASWVVTYEKDGRQYEQQLVIVGRWLYRHVTASQMYKIFGISYVFRNEIYIIYIDDQGKQQ